MVIDVNDSGSAHTQQNMSHHITSTNTQMCLKQITRNFPQNSFSFGPESLTLFLEEAEDTHSLELLSLLDMSQHMLGEGVQDVQAVDFVPFGYRQVKGHKGNSVWLRDAKGSIKAGDEVGELWEIDELCSMWVIPVDRDKNIIGTTFCTHQ